MLKQLNKKSQMIVVSHGIRDVWKRLDDRKPEFVVPYTAEQVEVITNALNLMDMQSLNIFQKKEQLIQDLVIDCKDELQTTARVVFEQGDSKRGYTVEGYIIINRKLRNEILQVALPFGQKNGMVFLVPAIHLRDDKTTRIEKEDYEKIKGKTLRQIVSFFWAVFLFTELRYLDPEFCRTEIKRLCSGQEVVPEYIPASEYSIPVWKHEGW